MMDIPTADEAHARTLQRDVETIILYIEIALTSYRKGRASVTQAYINCSLEEVLDDPRLKGLIKQLKDRGYCIKIRKEYFNSFRLGVTVLRITLS